MSHPIDQIENSRTKPLQMEHDGQMNSGRSQSNVRLDAVIIAALELLVVTLQDNGALEHGPIRGTAPTVRRNDER
jgi:hypothetical protein